MMSEIIESLAIDIKEKEYRPIEVFKDKEQLKDCLEWWQDKLGLGDWIIKVDKGPEDNGEDGFINFVHERKAAQIIIADNKNVPRIGRYCEEETLCHELLHCIYAWMEPNKSYEGIFMAQMEHQRLDDLAKTLIMVKYSLSLAWWRV